MGCPSWAGPVAEPPILLARLRRAFLQDSPPPVARYARSPGANFLHASGVQTSSPKRYPGAPQPSTQTRFPLSNRPGQVGQPTTSKDFAKHPKSREAGWWFNNSLSLNHHPVRSIKEASRYFFDVASTPPGPGGAIDRLRAANELVTQDTRPSFELSSSRRGARLRAQSNDQAGPRRISPRLPTISDTC